MLCGRKVKLYLTIECHIQFTSLRVCPNVRLKMMIYSCWVISFQVTRQCSWKPEDHFRSPSKPVLQRVLSGLAWVLGTEHSLQEVQQLLLTSEPHLQPLPPTFLSFRGKNLSLPQPTKCEDNHCPLSLVIGGFEIGCQCTALAVLRLTLLTRLDSNSERWTCLYLPSCQNYRSEPLYPNQDVQSSCRLPVKYCDCLC